MNRHLSLGAIISGALACAVFAVLLAALVLVLDRLFTALSWLQILLAWGMLSVVVVFGPLLLRSVVQGLRGLIGADR